MISQEGGKLRVGQTQGCLGNGSQARPVSCSRRRLGAWKASCVGRARKEVPAGEEGAGCPPGITGGFPFLTLFLGWLVPRGAEAEAASTCLPRELAPASWLWKCHGQRLPGALDPKAHGFNSHSIISGVGFSPAETGSVSRSTFLKSSFRSLESLRSTVFTDGEINVWSCDEQ